MILLPAIDLYDGKVVRLTKGDYAQMTVYRDDPAAQAVDFQAAGAKWLHTVDLEGAKDGTTPNFGVIAAICKKTDLKVEIGGGIRSLEKGRTWYTSNSGLAELREETCNYLSRRMGLSPTAYRAADLPSGSTEA